MLHIQSVLVQAAGRLDIMSDVFVLVYHIVMKVLGCYLKLSYSHFFLHDFQLTIYYSSYRLILNTVQLCHNVTEGTK